MKNEKNIFIASVLNFFVWGSGYFYLNKQDIKGYVTFSLYVLIWLFSMMFILTASPLILPVIFWVIFWSMWCSIFLAYDIYSKSKEVKMPPLKIRKVKTVVRRSKVRTRKK
jgi:hypothetical protein